MRPLDGLNSGAMRSLMINALNEPNGGQVPQNKRLDIR